MKLGEIASKLGCALEGDANLEITGVAGIEEAQTGELTFLTNRKYRPALETTRASAILITKDEARPHIAALRSANPYLDFARAIELFHPAPKYAPGVHPAAVVAKSAKIGANAHIGPYCFVDEGVEIGANAVLHSFVSIYRGARIGDDFFAHSHACVREGCRIGNRVLLQNGVVVGSDGFGFAREANGHWYKMRQSGIAVIEDDVEIQAQSAIDRATVGETHIGRGTKIDNLVQVGHACKVRGHAALRTGRPCRHDARGQPLYPRRTSRRRGSFDDRRRRDADGAERRSRGRSRRRDLLRLPRDGQSCLAKIRRRLQPPARLATRTPRTTRGSGPPPRGFCVMANWRGKVPAGVSSSFKVKAIFGTKVHAQDT